jgi:hypothetical protein
VTVEGQQNLVNNGFMQNGLLGFFDPGQISSLLVHESTVGSKKPVTAEIQMLLA